MTDDVRDILRRARGYAEAYGNREFAHRINCVLKALPNEPHICPVSAAECYVTPCPSGEPIQSRAPRDTLEPVECEFA